MIEQSQRRDRKPYRLVPAVAALTALATLFAPATSRGATSGHFCGAGLIKGTNLTILCQEMPPFPVAPDIRRGFVQAGPETTPTLIKIVCAHVSMAEVSPNEYLMPPGTAYASAKPVGATAPSYLIKISDGGIRRSASKPATDYAGIKRVASLPLDDGRCGASQVGVGAVAVGAFYTRSN